MAAAAAHATVEQLRLTSPDSDHQPECVTIAHLYLVDGWTPAEIAERLALKRQEVYNCLHRLVKPAMRHHLDRLRAEGTEGGNRRS